jgi:5'-nucleotidase
MLPDAADGTVLNVNVPSLPAEQLRGIRSARLAPSGAVQTVVDRADVILRMSVGETPSTPETGSDSAALAAGYASVTVLRALRDCPRRHCPGSLTLAPRDSRHTGYRCCLTPSRRR